MWNEHAVLVNVVKHVSSDKEKTGRFPLAEMAMGSNFEMKWGKKWNVLSIASKSKTNSCSASLVRGFIQGTRANILFIELKAVLTLASPLSLWVFAFHPMISYEFWHYSMFLADVFLRSEIKIKYNSNPINIF